MESREYFSHVFNMYLLHVLILFDYINILQIFR